MDKAVYWLLELSVKPGALGRFRELMAEMVAATRANEPGALIYDWSLGDGDTVCNIFEWYADSSAVMVHMQTFGEKYAARFMDAAELRRVTLFGNPDERVRQVLANFGPVYMKPFGGFSRLSA